jgi:hypothetical protein
VGDSGTTPRFAPFGYLSFVAKGLQKDTPLLSSADFQKPFEQQKALMLDKKGLHLVVDFKKKTRSVHFSKGAFAPLMAPH